MTYPSGFFGLCERPVPRGVQDKYPNGRPEYVKLGSAGGQFENERDESSMTFPKKANVSRTKKQRIPNSK